jgi:hypothetical protein
MNAKWSRTLLGAATLVCGSVGCCAYRDWVDVSYPERYNYEARHIVADAIATQVENGHVLDQTVWNAHFDPGTDRLTPAGMRALMYMARRRPAPDAVVYLETANDIPMDPDKPQAIVEARMKLNMERQKIVESFMTAQTGMPTAVVVQNPSEPSLYGPEGVSIMHDITGTAHGTMQGAGGATGGAGNGAAPPGGGAPGGGR